MSKAIDPFPYLFKGKTLFRAGVNKPPTGTYQLLANMNVRRGPGTNFPIKRVKEVTANARKHTTSTVATANAVLKKGTRVSVKEVRAVGKAFWGRIPSGWLGLVGASGKIYARRV